MLSRFLIVLPAIMLAAWAPQAAPSRPDLWRLSGPVIEHLAGERAKAHVVEISRWYREDATPGFHEAAAYIAAHAREAGLRDVHVESFPVDGQMTRFGVRTRYGWTPRRAELWITDPEQKLADFAHASTHLATWSIGAEVEAPLVDIGAGSPSDYDRHDVKGAIVLTSNTPAAVQHEAVAKRGAVGIVSYWSPPSRASFPDQIQWLDTANNREAVKAFAFVLSARQGRALKARLAAGPVTLRAMVDAELRPGTLEVVSGLIPGRDRSSQEVILVAHICHFSPSSNDNASGSGLLLELARTWQLLIDRKILLPPARNVRFLWVPENHGTVAYVEAHPEVTKNAVAALSLDMVGEDLDKTGALFRFVRTPDSRPSALNDVVEYFTSLVAAQNITAPTGSKSPFRYAASPYLGGSDHAWFNDAGVAVPAMLFMHWPDNFYHSSEDSPDKVDPTELKRIGLITFSTAQYFASATGGEISRLARFVFERARSRMADERSRAISHARTPEQKRRALSRLEMSVDREARAVASLATLDPSVESSVNTVAAELRQTEGAALRAAEPSLAGAAPPVRFPGSAGRYRRVGRYLSAAWRTHLAAALTAEELARATAFQRSLPFGDFSVSEVLNLMDGRRTLDEIARIVETQDNGDYVWNEYYGDGSMTAPDPYSGKPVNRAALVDFVALAAKAGLLERVQ